MAGEYVMDPFYALSREIESTKTKVADSVFEGYKLSVAQTNDINNRAMQVALHDTAAFADIKQQIAKGIEETMLAAARTNSAIGATAGLTERMIMEEGVRTRDLIAGLNTQNLNTALINQNTSLVGGGVGYGQLGLAYGGLNSAVQSVNLGSAVNALQSQIQEQSLVNTGVMSGSVQEQTPTNVV
jgi:phage gpG-like protein